MKWKDKRLICVWLSCVVFLFLLPSTEQGNHNYKEKTFLLLFCAEFLIGCAWIKEKLVCGVRDEIKLITRQPMYDVTFQIAPLQPGTFRCHTTPEDEAVTVQSCNFTSKGEAVHPVVTHVHSSETETNWSPLLNLPPDWEEYLHFFNVSFSFSSHLELWSLSNTVTSRTNVSTNKPQWGLAECNLHVHCPREHSEHPTPPPPRLFSDSLSFL